MVRTLTANWSLALCFSLLETVAACRLQYISLRQPCNAGIELGGSARSGRSCPTACRSLRWYRTGSQAWLALRMTSTDEQDGDSKLSTQPTPFAVEIAL